VVQLRAALEKPQRSEVEALVGKIVDTFHNGSIPEGSQAPLGG